MKNYESQNKEYKTPTMAEWKLTTMTESRDYHMKECEKLRKELKWRPINNIALVVELVFNLTIIIALSIYIFNK